MSAHPALYFSGDFGRYLCAPTLFETLTFSKARLWKDGTSASLTGWPRVYMGKIAHKNLRSDLAHKHGFWGQIAVE